jgi:tRNA threonylcarbamoyladenosine biosynthesis protein TsaB
VNVLGIDTATWTASVGVCADGRTIAERSLPSQGSHGFSLMPLIAEVLREAELTAADLGGVAVSIGPGSFTGLRIGLATAKGIAFANGVALAGVRTLPALAQAAEVPDGLVCPILDARKGEVYTALIEMHRGEGLLRHAEVAIGVDRWLAMLGDRACTFVGDAVDIVRPHARRGWSLLPFARFHPRGAIIAALGWRRLDRGDADDLASLEPLYVRPSEAELKSL